jgi:hypothetical protein
MRVRAAAADLLLRCAPNGAASNPTFWCDRDSQEDQKDRRREMRVCAAAADLLLRCAPNGAASNPTLEELAVGSFGLLACC